MLLTDKDAKALTDKVLSFSKAESATVTIKGNNSSNIRFALNSVTTSGAGDYISIEIESNFGRRSGKAEITSLEDSAIAKGVLDSEEIAKLSPEMKEFMPPLDNGFAYSASREYFESTAGLTPSQMAKLVAGAPAIAEKSGLKSAGYFEADKAFTAIGNTNGLYAFHNNTFARFAATMRTSDATGSSKIDKSYADIHKLDIESLSHKLADRSLKSGNPQKLEAGKYTVVLDYSAACDMLTSLTRFLNMRSADEGRSFFSRDGGNRIGEKLFSEKVNIISDPSDESAPSKPFTDYGYPVEKTIWVNNGVLENMFNSRFWADKAGKKHIPSPTNIIMQGTDKSVEDLIATVDRGVFVTRFWYIRTVDPKQILLTGLTRDGVFLIENGKISHPVNNFRFNESPVNVLSNLVDMSIPEKSVGSENVNARTMVPAMKVEEFNFSTISDAV